MVAASSTKARTARTYMLLCALYAWYMNILKTRATSSCSSWGLSRAFSKVAATFWQNEKYTAYFSITLARNSLGASIKIESIFLNLERKLFSRLFTAVGEGGFLISGKEFTSRFEGAKGGSDDECIVDFQPLSSKPNR